MLLQDIKQPVIFFDGVCNLCNRVVQFIIRHDKKCIFLFAPLQSAAGSQLAEIVERRNEELPDSVILYHKGKVLYRSSAALMIARLLGGEYRLLSFAYIFPAFIRDGLYRWIARNRYKWFGRKTACMIPTPELSSRFLA